MRLLLLLCLLGLFVQAESWSKWWKSSSRDESSESEVARDKESRDDESRQYPWHKKNVRPIYKSRKEEDKTSESAPTPDNKKNYWERRWEDGRKWWDKNTEKWGWDKHKKSKDQKKGWWGEKVRDYGSTERKERKKNEAHHDEKMKHYKEMKETLESYTETLHEVMAMLNRTDIVVKPKQDEVATDFVSQVPVIFDAIVEQSETKEEFQSNILGAVYTLANLAEMVCESEQSVEGEFTSIMVCSNLKAIVDPVVDYAIPVDTVGIYN